MRRGDLAAGCLFYSSFLLVPFAYRTAEDASAGSGGVVAVAVAIGILALVFNMDRVLRALDASRAETRRCRHGVSGGASGKCVECRTEQVARIAEIEASRREAEKKGQIQLEARNLRLSELDRLRQSLLASRESLLRLEPNRFEDAVAELFRARGYHVKQTPYTNDRGRDAIVIKAGRRYVMECKRYDTTRIGRRELQILVAAMKEERASAGIFVTTSSFAQTAVEYAADNRIDLIDASRLQGMMLETYGIGDLRHVAVICPSCGTRCSVPFGDSPGEVACSCSAIVRTDLTVPTALGSPASASVRCPLCGGAMQVRRYGRRTTLTCSRYPACTGSRARKPPRRNR